MGADRALLRRIPALRVHLGVCLIAAVATAAAVIAQAQVLADGISRLVDGDADALGPLVVALVVIGVVRGIARWATDRSATAAVIATRRDVTEGIVAKLDALDEPGRAAATPSTVTSLATTGVDALEPWIRSYAPALGLAAVVPLAAGVRILFADLLSAVILLIAVPLIPVFMILIGRLTEERSQRQWATLQRLGSHFHDVLVGLETLRLFGRAEAQIDRVRQVTDDYRRAVMGTLRVAFLSALVLELLATLSVALVAVTAGVRLADGTISLTTALVVLLLAPECSLPLRRVGAAFHAATAGADAVDDLEEVDALSESPDGTGSVTTGGLHVEDLVITDAVRGHRVGPVDLDVAPGEVVALVGPTGSGKSTVLAAVTGDTPIGSGSVEVGGVSIGDLSRDRRRAAIVAIPQHPAALGATVDESVSLGCPTSTTDGRRAALAAVGLDHAEARRPRELSGGERQRLAVARALLTARMRHVDVLVADEPTAHLDAERVALVVDGLRSVADHGTAVLVVTHDPTVIAAADRVVRLTAVAAHSPMAPTGPTAPADLGHESGHPAPGRPDDRAAPPRLLPEPIAGDTTAGAADAGAGGTVGDLAWFGRLAPASRGRIAGARALGIAAEACTIGLAGTAAWLILRAAEHPSFADLAVVAVAVRAFGLGKGVLRYAERLASHDATLRRLGGIRATVVGQLGRLVPAGLPRTGRGEMLSSVVDDVDRLGDLELRIVGPAISSVTVAAAAVVGVAVVAGPAAVVLAAALAIAAVLVPLWVGRRALGSAASLVASKSAVATRLLDLAEHSGEIAALGATAHWAEPIAVATVKVTSVEQARWRTAAAASGLLAALGPWTAAATAAVVGGPAAGMSGPAIGVAVLLPLAVIELVTPSVAGAESMSVVAASASRLRALLTRPDPAPEPHDPAAAGPNADLALDDVSFSWPGGPPVLTGLDLALPEGSRLAVRGPSGSGKSTLAAGLVAFLVPADGEYTVGGVDSTALGGAQVRRSVTWCTQDPWLADTSIRENLRIAAPDARDDELWAALDAMRLGDWVREMPQGLDTFLGRAATTASGGQRHRLALARVLLSDHRVVVLDEPAAHLDADTAGAVLHDLVDGLAGRSVVVIGHGDTDLGFDAIFRTDAPVR